MPSAGQWRWPALTMFTVGYGANQFVPLLGVYRRTLGLTDTQATAVFGVYALGLVPGLLVGGRASDRFGRRGLMIAFAALSLLATAVLAGGQWGVGWLYAGRLLTGVVSGTVFTIGTAWVKELSDGPGPGWGPVGRASPRPPGSASVRWSRVSWRSGRQGPCCCPIWCTWC